MAMNPTSTSNADKSHSLELKVKENTSSVVLEDSASFCPSFYLSFTSKHPFFCFLIHITYSCSVTLTASQRHSPYSAITTAYIFS